MDSISYSRRKIGSMKYFTGNVAYDKTGDQGPVTEYPAEKAIDGSHDPRLASGHCAWVFGGSTADPAWWQVDLEQTYVVISVNITNSNTEQGWSYGCYNKNICASIWKYDVIPLMDI